MCCVYLGCFVVGIDVWEGYVVINGWLEMSVMELIDFVCCYSKVEIGGIIYMDIFKDGMFVGLNFEVMKEMNEVVDLLIVVLGGVIIVEDISCLVSLGLFGCIIG